MRVGVIGLGRMGRPIANRLMDAGHDVTGYDTDPAALVGLPAAASPAQLGAEVDVVLTVLPGTPELLAVAERLGAPALWIDLTSADPRAAERVAEDRVFVGAPMGGSPSDAVAGTLRFFLSGPSESTARAARLLAPLGSPRLVGTRVGDGYTAKLLANLLWFGQSIAVAEALLLGQELGMQPAVLQAILAGSAGSSVYLERHAPRLLRGDYLREFGLERVVEELDALRELATSTGSPFELSGLVARLHREALTQFGPVDGELLATALLEERAGRTLRA